MDIETIEFGNDVRTMRFITIKDIEELLSDYFGVTIKCSNKFGGKNLSKIIKVTRVNHSAKFGNGLNMVKFDISDAATKIANGEPVPFFFESVHEILEDLAYRNKIEKGYYVITPADVIE